MKISCVRRTFFIGQNVDVTACLSMNPAPAAAKAHKTRFIQQVERNSKRIARSFSSPQVTEL